MKYHKLVRDKIPEIIEKAGLKPRTKTLSDSEFSIELEKKLSEEIHEYLESHELEELIDIEEVILKLIKVKGIKKEDFEKLREDKKKKRGAFDKKIFLIETTD